jgi:octaprenyl-diphosphate synthase
MARLLRVIASMVDAEAVQLELRGSVQAEREKVLRVIQGKTAALFGWVLWGGGRLAGLPDAECAALAAVGEALGIAFQLADDLLDLDGDQDETGKDVLADLRQGKLTWPFLIACERDPELLADLRAIVEQDQVAPGWLDGVRRRVVASGAVEATRHFAREQARLARERLRPLPEGRVRDSLETVIEAAVERSR